MNKNKERTVNIDQYIDSIFDKLPSNAIINKGRCGIGGTTLEIETLRDSIIVVPTIGIIDSKCSDYEGKYKSNPKIFGIHGTVGKDELIEIFEDEHPVKKIFTTPAGLRKLMECGYDKEAIMQNWFLLLDEYHTAITDAFRSDILIPFDYFWSFPQENRAMITATPYELSDPRFLDLDEYNIKIKEKLGTVEIIHAESVLNCLSYVLRNTNQIDGNIHIFFNSVNEIANLLRINKVFYDVSIYIANNERNMDKLDELRKRFHDKPSPDNFSKINFYTSRYFEGWDLDDKNPTVILVTDTGITTTKLGIRNKAFQAVGRSRNPIDRIMHITNHRDKKELETFDEIKRQHIERAESVVKTYNEHVNDSIVKTFAIKANQNEVVEEYARINQVTNLAQRCSYLTDQFINQEFCNQDYNHIDYINEAWGAMNYNTKVLSLSPNLSDDYNTSPLAYKIEDIVRILYLIECDKARFLVSRYLDIKELLPENAVEWIDAYYIIGREKMIEVDYSPTEIRKLVIEKHNLEQEEELKKNILTSFLKGQTYTNESVKTILHKLYVELGIKNHKGLPKSGKAKVLEKYFKIKPEGVSRKVGRENYEAEFGKLTFTVDGKKSRKEGYKFY